MSYQPRVRSAIWTTLVLLLVSLAGASIVAATQISSTGGGNARARKVPLRKVQRRRLLRLR